MAIRSYKIALDATDEQCAWFSQQCGYARFAFNYALSDYNDAPRHWKELNSRFNKAKRDIDWTHKMDQRAALFGIKHLGDAISRWKGGQNRRPKRKRRRDRQSYSTDPGSVITEGKRMRLPKIGWVRTFQKLRHKGEITKVTISRTAHRWFVSITVIQKPKCDILLPIRIRILRVKIMFPTIEAQIQLQTPPAWAVLERELIDKMNAAGPEVLQKYTRADGTLLWPTTPDFQSIDGLDDAYESFP